MYYSRVLLQTPLFIVSKIMYLHSLATPGCWTHQPSPSCSTSISCLLITCGVYMELPHPAPSLCTMSGLYPSKKLKTKLFLKAGKCISWVWAHCPYCSLSAQNWRLLFPLRAVFPTVSFGKHVLLSVTPSEAAEDKQYTMLKHLSCCKAGAFLPKFQFHS